MPWGGEWQLEALNIQGGPSASSASVGDALKSLAREGKVQELTKVAQKALAGKTPAWLGEEGQTAIVLGRRGVGIDSLPWRGHWRRTLAAFGRPGFPLIVLRQHRKDFHPEPPDEGTTKIRNDGNGKADVRVSALFEDQE